MRDRLAIALRVSSAVLILCGYGALASVTAYPPFIMGIPILALALMPFGEHLDARHSAYRIITNALTIAFGCFLPLLFMLLGLLNTVIALVIYIQVYVL